MSLLKTTLGILLICFLASCGPTIYKAQNFEQSKALIKTVAILPFDVAINVRKLPKGTTDAMLKENEQSTGYNIQSNAYSWLLKRQKDFTTTFQDVSKTNSILKANNIGYEDLFTTDKGNLAKLLGVDAVFSGKATMSKPISEGGALAMGILVGAWGATNQITTNITMHDWESNLLWKYDYTASGSVGSSAESLTRALMKNASKKYPYKVK